MKKQIEENYLFEFEKDNNNRENKEFFIFEDGSLITIKFNIKEREFRELRQFLKKQFTYENIEIRHNVKLSVSDKNESFNDDGFLSETIISNTHEETKKEKIGFLKTKETIIRYGDITKIHQIKPAILMVLECIELKKYLNLVNIHNYIVACKEMSSSSKIYTYEGVNRTVLSKFSDLHINPNKRENSLTNEEILDIINRLFNCFKVTEISKIPIIDNQISIDISSSYDDLMNLKSKLKLAELNTKIVSNNIINNSFEDVKKILVRNNA